MYCGKSYDQNSTKIFKNSSHRLHLNITGGKTVLPRNQWQSVKSALTLFAYFTCILLIGIEIWNTGPSILLVGAGVGLILLSYFKVKE